MPQASEEQRKLWGTDGDVGEEKAIKFLKSHGYILQRNCIWKLPTPNHHVTQEEHGAMNFLIDEWDFGGYVRE